MPVLLLLLLLVVAIVAPGLWVKRILQRYSRPADRYAGSGGELARHMLDCLNLHDVGVEVTEDADHYDPDARVVRLTEDKLNRCSLTAVTFAAHEVGHAHQHASDYRPFVWRTRLVRWAAPGEKLGAGILMMAPFVTFVTRTPVIGLLMLLGGFLVLGLGSVIHLITLPMELDASFGRALPMLRDGGYLKPGDEPHARRLLKAAAFTYVASSLMSLLNVARWWAILRR